MNSRRGIAVAATVALAALIEARGARAADDGTASFDCAKDRSPLAVTICNDRPAAAAERRTTVSYLALYFKLDERSRAGFRSDHLQWIQAMSARCPQSDWDKRGRGCSVVRATEPPLHAPFDARVSRRGPCQTRKSPTSRSTPRGWPRSRHARKRLPEAHSSSGTFKI